jgi:hypothetical protein
MLDILVHGAIPADMIFDEKPFRTAGVSLRGFRYRVRPGFLRPRQLMSDDTITCRLWQGKR